MPQSAIDVDRGVTIRKIVKFDEKNPRKFDDDPKYGGLTVYMYKDTPGVYYDAHGHVLPDGIAKAAGYPTDKLAKEKARRDALAALDARLKAELAIELEEKEILAEAGSWQVIGLPMDRARVIDKETGAAVTPVPMSRADAKFLLKQLVAAAKEGSVAVTETTVTKE